MTNQQLPHCPDAVDASIMSMVHPSGPRRPVKIVEHPAFRGHRQPLDHIDHADDGHAPILGLTFRVVSLN
jgi:hypothetical protein